ncbi:B BOX 21, B-box domain protein 21, long hypocotyl under shade, salt tolerance homolog2 [Hibiscus trionum]|uniref:B BOX 21, B-box domain protein 21, long hypocotyl under shade, salt tolerance homolog2 n=1 Tax=Hibiscus trionum TaxID=183268 RepID=A0A9W7HS44_HIBTR|nr:B BOX 21, B-box domain protein 21, long hypocotyl under shade, salt tolerance homolog2 [Hibiscus trionum]
MKIRCDVCDKEEASVFCTADEAALCDACDHRVHHANKLASKHQRFSLLRPSSSKQVPLCDICQEKRAFLFCQQDRAILCRDCDVPIHAANEHTQKHNRFLLTGVKLSATSSLYTSSSSYPIASLSNVGDSVPEFKSQLLVKNPVSNSPPNFNPPLFAKSSSINTTTTAVTNNKSTGDCLLATDDGGSTSNISEYLMEMLPGWHVEDFLDSSSPPFGFCKSDDCMLPFLDADLESNMNTFSPESLGLWVPQSPSSLYPPQYSSQMGGQIQFKETKEIIGMKANRRWTDDSFTVPQISPQSTGSKRSKRV